MPASPFEWFISSDNARLVNALARNRDLSACVMGLIESAVNYANAKGVSIDKVRIRDSFVIPTDDGDAQIRVTFYALPDA